MMDQSPTMNKQKGVVLVISLIMLLMMTLLAVSSMRTTILEERMAGNFKDRNTAFEAAEAALREGESYLDSMNVPPIFDGTTTGLYQPTSSGSPRWMTVDWTGSTEVIVYAGALSGIAAAPKYIIEEMPVVDEWDDDSEAGEAVEHRYFRITARAVGNTASAIVMLQSTYRM